jgi:hypothetical protein
MRAGFLLAFLRTIARHGGMPRHRLPKPRRRPPTLPPPPLTVAEVITWADAHRDRTGRWPNAYSGPIPDAPLGTNWKLVDNGLRHGSRGLPGESSLAQLLAEQRGHRNIGALPRLTVAQILRWADAGTAAPAACPLAARPMRWESAPCRRAIHLTMRPGLP